MSWKKYNIKDLAALIGVTEEEFHREIKNVIKRDYKCQLKKAGYDNPDILLDDDNVIALADPRNNLNYFATDSNIFDYLE